MTSALPPVLITVYDFNGTFSPLYDSHEQCALKVWTCTSSLWPITCTYLFLDVAGAFRDNLASRIVCGCADSPKPVWWVWPVTLGLKPFEWVRRNVTHQQLHCCPIWMCWNSMASSVCVCVSFEIYIYIYGTVHWRDLDVLTNYGKTASK